MKKDQRTMTNMKPYAPVNNRRTKISFCLWKNPSGENLKTNAITKGGRSWGTLPYVLNYRLF